MSDRKLTLDVVTRVVDAALRAPSIHNSQPWQLRWNAGRLDVIVHADRDLPTPDVTARQLLISCGVLVDHLVASFAAAGWTATVRRFPNPNRHDLTAALDFAPAEFVTDAQRERSAAVRARRTDRLPYGAPAEFAEFEVLLRDVLRRWPVTVGVIGPDSYDDLARASRLAAGLRRYDTGYHAGLQWWTGDHDGSVGIPSDALVSEGERSAVPIGRDFPAADHEPRAASADRSTVLVLSTARDGELEYLQAGEALSAALLEATMAGYATCPLTHVTEVPASRDIVRTLVGPSHLQPQALIRVGTATREDPLPPTPRRGVQDVLEVVAQ